MKSEIFRIILMKIEFETATKIKLEKARNQIVKEAGLNGWI